jgi:S1-C subfamily serine protease
MGTPIAQADPTTTPTATPTTVTPTATPPENTQVAVNVPATTGADGLPAIPAADLALTDLTRFVQPGVVRLEVETEFGGGLGSGFVVNKSGVIVTNYHVIAGAVNAKAFFETEEEFPVTGVWHLDKERDIAVLQIDCPPEKLFPVNIATQLPAQGQDVAAFGAPHGLSFTVTRGIVSAIRSGEELDHKGTLVQHDVPINPGNSGGPLCTFRGEVVAINTFLLRGTQGLGFAISCMDIRECIDNSYSEMLAVNPENIPGEEGEIPGAVDYTDTEKGDALLARIRELDVVTLNLAQDPQGTIARYLEETAERQIELADIRTNQLEIFELDELDFHNPVMIVIYHFTLPEEGEDDNEDANYLDVMVHMQVVMTDVTEEGKPEICIVWNREEERIGSVAPAALIRGQLPNSVENGIREFIGEFVGRCRRARRD